MIKRKKLFFHFSTIFAKPWSQEKEIDFYCTNTLIMTKISFFHHMLVTCRKSLQKMSSPEKYVKLKNFLLQEFQWSLM